jgi:hypothetical protein
MRVDLVITWEVRMHTLSFDLLLDSHCARRCSRPSHGVKTTFCPLLRIRRSNQAELQTLSASAVAIFLMLMWIISSLPHLSLASSSALTLCARVHPKRESSSDRSNPKSSSFQQFLLHWRPEKSEKMLHLTRIRENPFCPLMFIYELIRLKCSCKSNHRNPTPIKNMPQRLQLAKLFLPSNHTNQKHLINLQITSP